MDIDYKNYMDNQYSTERYFIMQMESFQNAKKDENANKFNFLEFFKLIDDSEIINYVFNHTNSTQIKDDHAIAIFEKILSVNSEQEKILSTFLKFVSIHIFTKKVDCKTIFQKYLAYYKKSNKLLLIIIHLMKITEQTLIDENFIKKFYDDDYFHNDTFWLLCLYFRKFESKDTNLLWNIGLMNLIEEVITNYEIKAVHLSTIELIYKVAFHLLTSENMSLFKEKHQTIIIAADYFKQDFFEPMFIVLIFKDNLDDIEDIDLCI